MVLPNPTSQRQPTALIAEDDEKVGLMLGDTLRCVGFIPHVVFDGVQAIKDILEIKPDVIILDLVLPRLHAQEICSVVRNDPDLKATPIVVISGWARHEDRDAVFRMGADDFIVKPFHPDELVSCVRGLFEKVRQRALVPVESPVIVPA